MRLLSRMNNGQAYRVVRTLAHPWDTRRPALCRVRARWKRVLLDQQPSLLTLRRRAFRRCSSGSSVLCRCPTPRGRACGPYGLSLRPPSCGWLNRRCLRGLPVLVHEVSRRVWGLRLRRTEQKLALSLLSMLPSAHVNRIGVRIVSFRGSMATPPILCLRFAVSLAVAAQDSRPSGSLLLSS
jgi:hypothetical protein